jgi:hypothetical protein
MPEKIRPSPMNAMHHRPIGRDAGMAANTTLAKTSSPFANIA